MLSLRSLSRAAPRTLRPFSTKSARSTLRRPAFQTQSTFLRSSASSPSRIARTAFSTSRLQCASALQVPSESQVNEELVAKIESELSLEREIRNLDVFPDTLKEYIEKSPFEIHDVLGKEEVTLTRKFGDETIKITFSIDDLNNVDQDQDPDGMSEDGAMGDEIDDIPEIDLDGQSGGTNTKGSINQGKTLANSHVAPEDSVAAADRTELMNEEDEEDMDDMDQEQEESDFPTHCYITVERPGKGALQIEAVAQQGMMTIENVYYYKDGKLADPKTRSDEEASRDLYTGPPFGNLDEDLQFLFERYLEERGITPDLAKFVPDYIDYKEQKEYLNWLNGIKDFVK